MMHGYHIVDFEVMHDVNWHIEVYVDEIYDVGDIKIDVEDMYDACITI